MMMPSGSLAFPTSGMITGAPGFRSAAIARRTRQPEVLLTDLSVARDDERHRQPEQRPVRVVDLVLLLVAVEHGVIHLHLLGVRLRVLELVEQDDADDLEAPRFVLVVE